MNCPACGNASVVPGEKCPRCGALVPAAPREPAEVPPPPPPALAEPQLGTPASLGPPPPPGTIHPVSGGAASMTSGLAIASFVCSLTGAVACFAVPLVNLFLTIPGIAMGHVARAQIRRSGGTFGGDGLAVAGLVIGYVQLVLMCFAGVAIVALGMAFSFSLSDLLKQVP